MTLPLREENTEQPTSLPRRNTGTSGYILNFWSRIQEAIAGYIYRTATRSRFSMEIPQITAWQQLSTKKPLLTQPIMGLANGTPTTSLSAPHVLTRRES